MADDTEVRNGNSNIKDTIPVDEVFVNGDTSVTPSEDNVEDSMDANLPEKVLPRRSSLLKETTNRKTQRKKTVSFSSMPAERPITTGLTYSDFLIISCI